MNTNWNDPNFQGFGGRQQGIDLLLGGDVGAVGGDAP